MEGPCPGLTMLRTVDGQPFLRLHYSADETLTPDKVQELRRKFLTQAHWDREMEMDSHALDGALVYPEWDSSIHVIPDSKIPKRGCIYMSIDPHPRTPHAVMWILIDKYSDWYVFREMWPSTVYGTAKRLKDTDRDHTNLTIKDYAETIAALEGNKIKIIKPGTADEYGDYVQSAHGERIALRFMDQAGKAFRASGEAELKETYARRYARYGIQCGDPKKSVNVGEEAIHDLLRERLVDDAFAEYKGIKGRNWPRLHVSSQCVETIFEFQNNRYKKTRTSSEEKELKQEGSEYRTHMLDNLRYVATATQAAYVPREETTRYVLDG